MAEEDQNKLEELIEDVKEYINTRHEIIELKASHKLAVMGSEVISGLVIGLVAFLFVFFLSMAAGFYLNTIVGDSFSGFFIVTGFYLLIGILMVMFRKKLVSKPIKNMIIKEIFDED